MSKRSRSKIVSYTEKTKEEEDDEEEEQAPSRLNFWTYEQHTCSMCTLFECEIDVNRAQHDRLSQPFAGSDPRVTSVVIQCCVLHLRSSKKAKKGDEKKAERSRGGNKKQRTEEEQDPDAVTTSSI